VLLLVNAAVGVARYFLFCVKLKLLWQRHTLLTEYYRKRNFSVQVHFICDTKLHEKQINVESN